MVSCVAEDGATGREVFALRRHVAVCRHLSNLAVRNVGLDAVTELIAEQVDTAVAVVDETLTVLAAAEAGCSAEKATRLFRERFVHPRLAQVLGVVGPTGQALRIPGVDGIAPIIVAPVLVGDSVPAYLLTLDDGTSDDADDLRLLLTEHAATICGVVLGRERVVAAAAGQVRYDLVEGLLSGRSADIAEVRRWAAHLGYDENQDHRVLSLVVDGDNTASNLVAQTSEIVERFFSRQVPEAITAVRGHEVVVVLPELEAETARAGRLARACIARVQERSRAVSVTAGIGGVCGSALEIAGSYDDARRTVEILGRLGRSGAVVAIEELGIHRLLLRVADPEQLRAFAREVLGGFTTRTKGNTEEYLATVACYFRENHSPQRASTVLHVHPNTVAYRVRRVEELTKLDFRDYRDRLMAQVALEIIDMVGDTI